MEIMVVRIVDRSESFVQMFTTLKIAQALSEPSDPRKFYEGFAHQYFPNANKRD
jgi:hypothetical protein